MSDGKAWEMWRAWDDAVCSGKLETAQRVAADLVAYLGSDWRRWQKWPRWTPDQRVGFVSWCDDHRVAGTGALMDRGSDVPEGGEMKKQTEGGEIAQLVVQLKVAAMAMQRAGSEGLGGHYLERHVAEIATTLERVGATIPGADSLAQSMVDLIDRQFDEAEANEKTGGKR